MKILFFLSVDGQCLWITSNIMVTLSVIVWSCGCRADNFIFKTVTF